MKAIKENSGKAIPRCCAKCGGIRFETVEDGIQCFYCGWLFYLTDEQIEAIQRGGLDKTNPACKDSATGKETI